MTSADILREVRERMQARIVEQHASQRLENWDAAERAWNQFEELNKLAAWIVMNDKDSIQ